MLPPAARAALQLGVQTLRALGMRLTELAQCLPLSVATLKRYAAPASPLEGMPSRSLSHAQQAALTAYWVRAIARDRPLPPPVPARPFLAAFCPVCLAEPAPGARRRLALPTPHTLLEATLVGAAACQAGLRPCTSGPARFAGLVLAARVPPWAAAVFMATHLHPATGWWLRACQRCDRPIVTEHNGLRLCAAHRRQAA